MPCRCDTHGSSGNPSARGLHGDRPPIHHVDAGDLAVLDQVDTEGIGVSRESPSDVVVFGDAGARLVGRTEHRVPDGVGDVDNRAGMFDSIDIEPFSINTVEPVSFYPTYAVTNVLQVVRKV